MQENCSLYAAPKARGKTVARCAVRESAREQRIWVFPCPVPALQGCAVQRLESSLRFRYKKRLPSRARLARSGNAKSGDRSENPMSSVTTNHALKGLEGVVATTSKICYIDGDRGVLAYRGIDIHELAHQSNFEETCYLLWFGKVPPRRELRELHERLAEERKLDASIITLLRNAPRHALPMDVLRTAVSALSFYDPEEKSNDRKANVDKAIRITSQLAMIVAAYDRIRKGHAVVEPDRALSHGMSLTNTVVSS